MRPQNLAVEVYELPVTRRDRKGTLDAGPRSAVIGRFKDISGRSRNQRSGAGVLNVLMEGDDIGSTADSGRGLI